MTTLERRWRRLILTRMIQAFVSILLLSACSGLFSRGNADPGDGEGSRADSRLPGGTLGVSWPAFSPGGYEGAEAHAERLHQLGFELVCLVPTYTYPGLDRIDFSTAPTFQGLEKAVEGLKKRGFQVVLKPHLDPPKYQPGFDPFDNPNRSWRANCDWRGFFDLDPRCPDYADKILGRTLDVLQRVLGPKTGSDSTFDKPIRLEIGSELMNSIVYDPRAWLELLRSIRAGIEARGLRGRVELSHNFSHHFLIPEDFVARMDPEERGVLRSFLQGLDSIAVSQYMDLTVAVPRAERRMRLPTPTEIGDALLTHERTLRETILKGLLGLKDEEIPPLHIGEFGIGRGGLSHPNLWEGQGTPDEEQVWVAEVARGHEGLLNYLARDRGRRVESATLWVTGPRYDLFGWMNASWANPRAAELYRRYLRER